FKIPELSCPVSVLKLSRYVHRLSEQSVDADFFYARFQGSVSTNFESRSRICFRKSVKGMFSRNPIRPVILKKGIRIPTFRRCPCSPGKAIVGTRRHANIADAMRRLQVGKVSRKVRIGT